MHLSQSSHFDVSRFQHRDPIERFESRFGRFADPRLYSRIRHAASGQDACGFVAGHQSRSGTRLETLRSRRQGTVPTDVLWLPLGVCPTAGRRDNLYLLAESGDYQHSRDADPVPRIRDDRHDVVADVCRGYIESVASDQFL